MEGGVFFKKLRMEHGLDVPRPLSPPYLSNLYVNITLVGLDKNKGANGTP